MRSNITDHIKNSKADSEYIWELASLIINEIKDRHDHHKSINYFLTERVFINTRDTKETIQIEYLDALSQLPPKYFSPEETGRIAPTPDYRSDFYRLGLVLYNLFYDQDPFPEGNRLSVYWHHIASQPQLKLLDSRLSFVEKIIFKLLSKSKEDRYQSFYGLMYDWDAAGNLIKGKTDGIEIITGSKDLPSEFYLSEDFVGKVTEQNKVFEFLDDVEKNTSTGIIHIQAPKSAGKTSFLNSIIKQADPSKYLCLQSDANVDVESPYKMFIDAFENHLQWLMRSDPKLINSIKDRLISELGENIGVFTELSPGWEKIVGSHESVVLPGQRELLFRLSFVMSKVIAIFNQSNLAVLFIIDNIDQATNQSIQLLEKLLNEGDIKNFVLIVTESKSENTLEDGQQLINLFENKNLLKIEFEGLLKEDLNQLFFHSKINSVDIPSLSEIILSATKGNPQLLKEYIGKARQINCFSADYDNHNWKVNHDLLRTITITDDIQGLIFEKLNNLNEYEKNIAQACSVIGVLFDFETVQFVTGEEIEAITDTINILHQQSFIIPAENDNEYRFVSLEVQRAILSTCDKEKADRFHFKIVEIVVENKRYEENDLMHFKLVNHLLQISPHKTHPYRKIIKSASSKAASLAAFEDASNYLEFLLSGALYDNDDEKFEIQTDLMEMWVAGMHFQKYYELRGQIVNQNLTFIQRAKLDSLHGRTLMYEQKFNDSVLYSVDALKKIGVNIVLNPSLPRIIYDMVTTTVAINKKTNEQLKNLPFAKDELNKIRLQLLIEITSSFFLASPQSLPEVIAKTIKLSLKEGAHKSISLIFATYGFSISSFRKDFKRGEEMMELAYEYDNKYNNLSSKVICQFIHFGLMRKWTAPIAENADLLMKNYQKSLEVGSISIAYYSLGNASVFRLLSGQSITGLKPEFQNYLQVCNDKKQTLIRDFHKIMLQFMEDINAHETYLNDFEGSYFSASKDIPVLKSDNSIIAIKLNDTLLLLKKLFSGRYHLNSSLENLINIKETISKTGLGSLVNIYNYIFNYIILLLDESVSINKSEKYIKSLKEWSGYAYFNFGGWYHFAEALIAQRKQDSGKFLLEIDTAIEWFDTQKILYGLALAKLFRIKYRSNNLKFEIKDHETNEVNFLFKKWGLKDPDILIKEFLPDYIAKSKNDAIVGNLDTESLIKASLLIAGEYRTESLLEKLTQVLIENAGADKVNIYQPVASEWIRVAMKKGSQPADFFNKTMDAHEDPVSLIYMVINKQQTEILDDISLFFSDPYFNRVKPQSAMAIPVLKNRTIKAIIYLENSLVRGTFSAGKVELIRVLAGNLATLLENTSLYDDMEKRVEERTKELTEKNKEIENNNQILQQTLDRLKQTQTQLIQSEKMASLGQLTAGIAHEIQNPLNFVTNFSEVNLEFIEELEEELKNENKEEVNNIIEILKSNLDKIKFHGRRADTIVKGMLQHSRKNSENKELANINELCDEYLRFAYHGYKAKDKSFNITYSTDFDSSLPKVNILIQDVGRVILNILNNAFYAVREKSKLLNSATSENQNINHQEYKPAVKMTTRLEKNNVLIVIEDNGMGMPEAIKEKVFQPFFTTKPAGEGTGLGLSLSYDIITQGHSGVMKMESKEGEGTKFYILLPL